MPLAFNNTVFLFRRVQGRTSLTMAFWSVAKGHVIPHGLAVRTQTSNNSYFKRRPGPSPGAGGRGPTLKAGVSGLSTPYRCRVRAMSGWFLRDRRSLILGVSRGLARPSQSGASGPAPGGARRLHHEAAGRPGRPAERGGAGAALSL